MKKITAKELAIKMAISERSAKTLLKDVREEKGIKIVTSYHISEYLKIPHSQVI